MFGLKEIVIFFLLVVVSYGCMESASTEPEEGDTSQEQGRLLLLQNHGGYPAAWGQNACDACHPLEKIHEGVNVQGIVRKIGYQSCMGCHGDNGTGQPRPCIICHNQQELPEKPYLDGSTQHNLSGSSAKIADSDCVACHQASNMDGVMNQNIDLTNFPDALGYQTPYQNESDFCLRCHNETHQQAKYPIQPRYPWDPYVHIEESYHLLDVHGPTKGSGNGLYTGLRNGYQYSTTLPCKDCHHAHSSNNHGLIVDHTRRGLFSLSANLRIPGRPITTSTGDMGQLCVSCHAMNNPIDQGGEDAGNGLTGVHLVKSDCKSCHSHGETAQKGL